MYNKQVDRIFPRKMANIQKMFAQESNRWLLYLTLTDEHLVFGIGRGIPVLRFLTKCSQKTPFFASTG